MADIEIEAMTLNNIPEDVARGWVVKALEDLKAETITHIPFKSTLNVKAGIGILLTIIGIVLIAIGGLENAKQGTKS